MTQMNIQKKAGKALTWSFLTELLSKLVMPIVNMVLARLLAPEAFGAVATVNLVITFAEVFTDAGFQKYIVQHEFDSEDELYKSTNVAFWTNTFVSIVFISAIAVARHPLAELVGSPGLGNAISLASLNILIVTFCSTQTAVYRRAMDFKKLFYAKVCTLFIPALVTVPLAFLLRSYWALLIGTLVTNSVNAIVLASFSKWKPKLTFDFGMFRNMFSFSMWILLDAIAVWLTAYIGTFIVGRSLDDYYLGLYKTSMTTINSITSIFASSIVPVMFSQLSRCQNDDNEMKKTFYTYQRLAGLLLIPMGVGMFLYRDLLRTILLGDQWVEATEFLGIWGLLSSVCIILADLCGTFYRSKGKPVVALISQLCCLCILSSALFISVRFGFRALYYARSLATIFAILQALFIMRVLFKFKVHETIGNLLPVILSSLIMAGVAIGLQQLGSSILWQFASVFICIIAYFSVLLLLFPKMRKELFALPLVEKMLKKVGPRAKTK